LLILYMLLALISSLFLFNHVPINKNGWNDSPVIVTDPPKDTELPLIVILELVKDEFPILLKVFEDPEIVLLVRVSAVDADIVA
jgi:hypothetical protein